ncbi:MAG: maleylacetoacetate isomerase [Gammaproteobacteria bacterium]|nr:maleylacetoacetate isomerase [Gammaproteobacteria bacterium]MCH9744023.1 maleylacetoacetate isomerase [Gammaproteobacteria bacterium]
MVTLYDYFRSSASFRVRIALNLKKVQYTLEEVHLVNNGGEQHSESYKKLNPQELVPTLVDNDITLTQSMAILDFLESKYPDVSLFVGDLQWDAKIRSVANIVACDIHPLDNLRVLQYLKNTLGIEDSQKSTWYAHWIALGFASIEQLIDGQNGFCYADKPTLADVCLVPQVYNAFRFKCPMQAYPKIVAIYQTCMKIDEFREAAPQDWLEIFEGASV